MAEGNRYERRRTRTRAALVGAARRLFAERGFDATTIAQIAQEADTAHGSFYNHFRTKEEILEAVFEDTLTEHSRHLADRRRDVDDPAERVAIGHRHLLQAVRDDPDWGWLLVRLGGAQQP